MKFILTINWTLINFDEVQRIEYEHNEKLDMYFSYFIMKNGDKFEAHESFNSFAVDDEQKYEFCAWCHKTFNLILLNYIIDSDEKIIDIEKSDEKLWMKFIEICRENISCLTDYKGRKLRKFDGASAY